MKNYPDRKTIKSRSTIQENKSVISVVEPIPPGAVANELVSFSLTLDSVVATATLTVDDSHTNLFLHWGDGTTEVINLRELRLVSPMFGGNQFSNTLKFQHVYRAPFDQGAVAVMADTRDSDGGRYFETIVAEVNPRYKLSFYPIVLTFFDHLDVFGQYSEMEVNMSLREDGQDHHFKEWIDDVVTAAYIKEPGVNTAKWILDGSSFSREISFSDEPIFIDLKMREYDGIVEADSFLDDLWGIISWPFRYAWAIIESAEGDFDNTTVINRQEMPLRIHPNFKISLSNGNVRYMVTDGGDLPEGKVVATFNYELNLIIPLDKTLEKVIK